MDFTIFYAWQSDTDQVVNRYFIRDAMAEAVKRLRRNTDVVDRPELDFDTKGIPGTPDIFNTILEKIDKCGVFLGDVTTVAKTEGGKKLPNANVMLEAGYAFARIGDRRVLLVTNDALGRPTELPFDLSRRRWPLSFSIDPGVKPTREQRDELANRIASAVAEILKSGPVTNLDLQLRQRIRVELDDPRSFVRDDDVHLNILRDDSWVALLGRELLGVEVSALAVDAAERDALRQVQAAYGAFKRSGTEFWLSAVQIAGKAIRPRAPRSNEKYWRYCVQYLILVLNGMSR